MPEDDTPKRKRAFNFRPTVLAAFAVMAGALVGAAFNLTDITLLIGFICAAVMLTVAFIFSRKRKRILGFIIVFVVGFTGMVIDLNMSQVDDCHSVYAEVSGRVSEETVKDANGGRRFYLDGITVDGVEEFGVMEVEIDDAGSDPKYALGDKVTVFCEVENVEINPFSSDFSRYDKMGITYKATLKDWREADGKDCTLTDKVMIRLDGAFSKVFSQDEKGVANSLLFGDKSNLDAVDYQNIRAAGLAHIFAVSGLHIGFLVAVVAFILKKLKANNWITAGVLAILLLTYGTLCGFPSSMIRASVMTAVVFLARILKKRPDSLSTLATAVFIIVLFNPTAIFDVGFQMSVASVGGIILFATPLAKKLRNALKSRFVSGSVSLSVSATVGLFPVMTNVFNTFSVYFVLSNLICLPIVSVLFVYLAVGALICLAVPAAAPILYPVKYLIFAVMRIVEFIAGLPFAVIGTMSIGAIAVVYVVTMVNLSRFNMLDKADKTHLTVVSIAVALLLFILFYSGVTIIG